MNDKDGFVANFWRALAADPESVSHHANWPVNENDLHARHSWLVGQRETLTAQLEGDPDFFDVKIAGWWVWGIACWIGGGWCSGNGPWQVDDAGRLVHLGDAGRGVQRRRVHLGDAGRGVQRRLVHLGGGRGVQRKRVHLGDAGQGEDGLVKWMQALAERLRHVRVCCGDWARVCGPSPTVRLGLSGIFLDPPYADTAGRDSAIYAMDSESVAHDVRRWAIEHGDDPLLRIALCGYRGEHEMPAHWTAARWKAHGGYSGLGDGAGRANAARETVWFSPHCLRDELPLFPAGPVIGPEQVEDEEDR